MDIATVAVIACAAVAVSAVLASLVITRLLVGALRQERRDHLRTVVAEKKAELATTPEQLAAVTVTESLPDHLLEPTPEPKPAKMSLGQRASNFRKAQKMKAAFMDPNDQEESEYYDYLVSMDIDPADSLAVAQFNEMTAEGAHS